VRFLFFSFLIFITSYCFAQRVSSNADACLYYSNAQAFIKQKNYEDAILEMREAVALDKNNMLLNRDYAYTFLLHKKYGPAAIIIEETMKLPDADETVFVLACEIHSIKNDYKSASIAIDNGIQKFPLSAQLLSTKAAFLYSYKEDAAAIDLWQRAIDIQPNYADSYYQLAAALDTNSATLAKSIFYAECYWLTDRSSAKGIQMQQLLFRNYEKLYHNLFNKNTTPKITLPNTDSKNVNMEYRYFRILKSNKYILIDGFTLDNLISLRKRSLEDWVATQSSDNIPAMLQYHQRLMHEQLFDVYNTILFGKYMNANYDQQWEKDNKETIFLLQQFLNDNRFILQ
jgi:tetratricopeptide (TPR) repeat protein